MDEPNTERLAPELISQVSKAARHPCLIALKGPDKGATFKLVLGVAVLGRSGDKADIVVTGNGISRAHAEIGVKADGSVEVVDLNSTNGIFVNGTRVERAILASGDTLALGPEVVLRLDFPDEQMQQVFEDMYRGATLDGLTNVLNRRSFLERLGEEYSAGKRHTYACCLALVDVDHFKSINDGHGHPAGDAVLVRLAAILKSSLRAEDMVGRYGGEEFILFLRFSDVESGRLALDRMREMVEQETFRVPSPEGPKELRLTVSVGMAQLTPISQIEAAIQAADEALYSAKRGGRNRVQVA